MTPERFKAIDAEMMKLAAELPSEEIQLEVRRLQEGVQEMQARVASLSRLLIDRRELALYNERVKLSENDRSYISPPRAMQEAINRSQARRDAFDADTLPEA